VARGAGHGEPGRNRQALAIAWPADGDAGGPPLARRSERRASAPAAADRARSLRVRAARRVGPPNSLLTPLS
jgi:hypothetical protein